MGLGRGCGASAQARLWPGGRGPLREGEGEGLVLPFQCALLPWCQATYLLGHGSCAVPRVPAGTSCLWVTGEPKRLQGRQAQSCSLTPLCNLFSPQRVFWRLENETGLSQSPVCQVGVQALALRG